MVYIGRTKAAKAGERKEIIMKIGIIVHSKTGNTLSVAQGLKEKLTSAGHMVSLEQVTAANDDEINADRIQLIKKPDIGGYDALIIGAPVRGFSFSPVMTAYISKAGSLHGKKIACFVTQAFPFPAMGGNQAIGQALKLCEACGASVCETGIINRSNFKRKKMTEDLIERFGRLF
jgi:flavodoxin